jgi:hypothetical protein
MKFFISITFLLLFYNASSMLVDTTIPGPLVKIKMELDDGSVKKGFVRYTTDSTAFFSRSVNGSGYSIPVDKIEAISYKDGVSFFPRILIGSAAGFIVGFLLGLNNCDDEDRINDDCGIFRSVFGRETVRGAFIQGIVFGGIGFMAGAFTGRISYRFPIHKSRKQFQVFRYHVY